MSAIEWDQDEESVEIRVPLPSGTRARSLNVQLVRSNRGLDTLKVGRGDELLFEAALFDTVKSPGEDSPFWSLSDDVITFTLDKDSAVAWPILTNPSAILSEEAQRERIAQLEQLQQASASESADNEEHDLQNIVKAEVENLIQEAIESPSAAPVVEVAPVEVKQEVELEDGEIDENEEIVVVKAEQLNNEDVEEEEDSGVGLGLSIKEEVEEPAAVENIAAVEVPVVDEEDAIVEEVQEEQSVVPASSSSSAAPAKQEIDKKVLEQMLNEAGEEEDPAIRLEKLQKLCDMGLAEGQYAMALHHVTTGDPQQALEYLEQSAKQFFPPAMLELAQIYMQFGKIGEVIAMWKQGAEANNSFCVLQLGAMYFEGVFLGRDLGKARELFTRAFELNPEFRDQMPPAILKLVDGPSVSPKAASVSPSVPSPQKAAPAVVPPAPVAAASLSSSAPVDGAVEAVPESKKAAVVAAPAVSRVIEQVDEEEVPSIITSGARAAEQQKENAAAPVASSSAAAPSAPAFSVSSLPESKPVKASTSTRKRPVWAEVAGYAAAAAMLGMLWKRLA